MKNLEHIPRNPEVHARADSAHLAHEVHGEHDHAHRHQDLEDEDNPSVEVFRREPLDSDRVDGAGQWETGALKQEEEDYSN